MKRLLLIALSTLPVLLQAGQLSKADLYSALNDAIAAERLPMQTSQGEEVTLKEVSGVSDAGAWKLMISNACLMEGANNSTSNNYGKAVTFRYPAVIANQAGSFVFMMSSQPVNDSQRAAVEKALVERNKTLNDEYGDMKGVISQKKDGSYQLLVNYEYGASTSKGKVADRIQKIIANGRFMLCDIYDAKEASDWKLMKDLRGQTLSTLNKAQFVSLYPLFKDPAYEKAGSAPEGQWVVRTSDDFKIWIENFGDKMKLWVNVGVKGTVDPAKSKAILAELQAMEPFGGAESMEVYAEPGFFWVATVHNYAGKSGKDIEKALVRFVDKDSDGFYSRAKKIVAKNL